MNVKNKSMFRLFSLMLLAVLSTQIAWAQLRVSGKVVDATSREEVIGATVVVKGTTNGTVTDINGVFTLSNVPSNGTLEVSYINYKKLAVPVAGKSSFDIFLHEDAQALDEIVVVGYGVQRKSDLTGAVSTVKLSNALVSTPSSGVTNALEGRVPGVSIVSSSGQPGASFTIRVRGSNSLQADGGPLTVVDGIIGATQPNPEDIESVEILKDASATAVYGSRGANGVILITTKRPEVGRVKVSYNGFVNTKTPYKLPDVMSPGEFAQLANDYAREFGASAGQQLNPFYTDEQIAGFNAGQGGFDYMRNVFRSASIEQNHNISISGGAGKTRFLISGSYNNNNGIVHNTESEGGRLRAQLDSEVKDWLKFGTVLSGSYNRSNGVRFSQYNNLLIHALTFPTTIIPIDPSNGEYNNLNLLGPQYNPMLFINEVDQRGYSNNTNLLGYVDLHLAKGLTLRSTQAVGFTNSNQGNTYGQGSYDYYQNFGNRSSATATMSDGINWTNTNVLSYVREFNRNHRINTTAVFEQSQSESFKVTSQGIGLSSTIVGANNTSIADEVRGSSEASSNGLMSGMLRANYVFMNRYMFTGSWRIDGSSRLAFENRWQQFPSMAFAWNIYEEGFMDRTKEVLSQLKFRYGFGVSGNQGVPLYSAYSRVTGSRDANGNLVLNTSALGNPDLKWEVTEQHNAGLDLGFLNNRLTFTLDLYNKLSKDVLLNVDAPDYTGFGTRLENAAKIRNRGFELTIGGDPISTKNVMWNTTLILSKNDGRIMELAQGKTFTTISGGYENNFFRNIVGERLATMWGYKCLGVWSTDEIAALKSSISPADFAKMNIEPGSYKYEDLDGVPGITADDQQIIGNGQPTFNWSWNNFVRYKNFDFSVLMVGTHGFDIYNHTRASRIGLTPNPEMHNRWQAGVNEDATIAGFVKNTASVGPSSLFIENGSFVKVKSITVGYALPSALIKKAHITSMRVYASLQNPFLFTKYSGMDPEVALKTPITSGVDYGYYPNGRNYMVGLNFEF